MSDWLTIDEVTEKIREWYVWWSASAPFVTPREEGELAALWSLYDAHVEAQRVELTEEEFAYEYGRGAI